MTEQNFNQPSGSVMQFENPNHAKDLLENFFARTISEMHSMNYADSKAPELPLARIKKIMKLDEDVKMISAEAPILFAKAAELFIMELTLRAWVHTEDNKRRTLQRNDIAMAISKFDMFDFLIDIVPREEQRPTMQQSTAQVKSQTLKEAEPQVLKTVSTAQNQSTTVGTTDQVQYLLQLAAQQGTLGGLPSAPQLGPTQQIQIFPQGGGPPQTIQIAAPQPTHNFLAPQVVQVASLDGGQTAALVQNGQVIQQLQPPVLQQTTTPGAQAQPQQIQIVQHVTNAQAQLGAGGQIQLLRVTGNGGAASQPIILQATAAGTPQTATAAAQHQNPAPPQTQHHAAAQTIFLPNGQQVFLHPGTTIQQALHGEEETAVTVGH
ncbi:nuclear transcription factor Y subunit gamma-like isoform X2 [Varroa jacobsoni]|uniref:Nuclear transcription factor Y subunit gamma n=1 Tax=Varroa destructor TaxID=109461 RepID=A0A7M7M9A2_VARDE|nr:nuclear transcription factor Y subunit gamma-like isoform X2 [Varroa destructor]XP_022687649.1 nuclear transcription factor Y subunit gamma-like isoform X2 [Varroa jacobsoni]